MDAPVLNQPQHRLARDLAAHRIKTGKHHRPGLVINQHRHAGRILKRADVPAFAPDDAAFDVRAFEQDGGRGVLKGLVAGVTLDRHGDDLAGLFLGARLGLVQNLPGDFRAVGEGFLLDFLEKLSPGFGRRKTAELLQLLAALLGEGDQFLLGIFEGGALALQHFPLLLQIGLGFDDPVELGIQQRFAFGQAAFLRGEFGAVRGQRLFDLRAELERFLVGGGAGLFQLRVGFAPADVLAAAGARIQDHRANSRPGHGAHAPPPQY